MLKLTAPGSRLCISPENIAFCTGTVPIIGCTTNLTWFETEQGAPLESIGSLIDITAGREAQEALRFSEKRYRAIVECQTDLIDRFLPDGTLIYVNDAVCRLLGNSREELIGQSFLPFLTTEARELVLAQLKSLTPERPEAESEQEVIIPDGSSRWLTWMNYAFFDDQGQAGNFRV